MRQKQTEMKDPGYKYLLGEEPEVDRPLVEEDPAEVEGPDDVLGGGVPEEGSAEQELDPGADTELAECREVPEVGQIEDENCRGVEQDVHLDRDPEAEHDAAQAVPIVHEEIYSCVDEENCHWIIEEAEDEDGMYSVAGEAHEDQDIGRDLLGPGEDPEHQAEGHHVEQGEHVLGQEDVGALAGDVVQAHVQPDEPRRVDQRTRVAPQ